MRFLEFDIPSVSNVADLGCGPGWALIEASRQGVGSVVGLEISRGILTAARNNFENSGQQLARLSLILGNSEHVPLRNDSFDCVVATELIEHTHYPEKLLSEIHRILKPGGYAILSFPVKRVENLICFFSKNFLRFSGHVRQFSLGEMYALLEQNGFRVVSRKNKFFEWSLYWFLRAVLGQVPRIDRTGAHYDAQAPEPRWEKFESFYKRVCNRLRASAPGRGLMAAGNALIPKSHYLLILKR